MEIKQQLRLSQQLVMTPQLQQAIRLLQLSRLELIDEIRKELDANPVLADDEIDPRNRTKNNDTIANEADPATQLAAGEARIERMEAAEHSGDLEHRTEEKRANELDLEQFESSDQQDRLERARRQVTGRTSLLGLVFGQIAVTQLLKPALIRSKGRVVNIGSVGGKIAVATYGPYAGTKFEPAGA